MRPETQLRGVNQKFVFFAQKLSNLGLVQNKLMQPKCVAAISVARIFDWGGRQTTNHMQ